MLSFHISNEDSALCEFESWDKQRLHLCIWLSTGFIGYKPIKLETTMFPSNGIHRPRRLTLCGLPSRLKQTKVVSSRLLHFIGPIRQIVTFLWSNQTDCYISLAQSDRLLPIDDWIRQILTYFEQGYVIWAYRASCNIPRSPPRSETLTSVISQETTMPVSQVCNSFISHQISIIVLTRCLPFCSTEPTYLTLL